MLTTSITVHNGAESVSSMDFSFRPDKTTVREMLSQVRSALKTKNLTLSSLSELKSVSEIDCEFIVQGGCVGRSEFCGRCKSTITNGSVVLLVVDEKSESRLLKVTEPALNSKKPWASCFLNEYHSWKGINLIQLPEIEAVEATLAAKTIQFKFQLASPHLEPWRKRSLRPFAPRKTRRHLTIFACTLIRVSSWLRFIHNLITVSSTNLACPDLSSVLRLIRLIP